MSTVGRRIDESSPMVDARLRDGSRVNAIIPPLAIDGPSLSIRRFRTGRLGADDIVERESMTQPMLDFLQAAVACRLNIIVSGGTGAGKTTLLNVLSGLHLEPRARRHDRGRRGADDAAAARGAARDAPAEHRRQGRGQAARPRRQRPPHASRPHHRRRGPERRGARHAAGDEHRPRRQPDDDSRQQPARRALSSRHDGRDGQPQPARARGPAADRVGRESDHSGDAAVGRHEESHGDHRGHRHGGRR